jgi:hypothetical protein
VQNAETAAWGRAIVAVLAADTRKGIASSEEVRNRQEKTADVKPAIALVPKPKAAARTYTDDELIYGVAIWAEIEATTDRQKLRELWTREKDFHEMKVNGTTILDAINARAAALPEEVTK